MQSLSITMARDETPSSLAGTLRKAQGRKLKLRGLLTILIVSVCTPFPVVAQDGGNAVFDQYISGSVDGESATWVLHEKPPFYSAVFSTLMPGVHNIRITGYTNARASREGSVTIEFNLLDGTVHEPRVLYFPFSPLHPRFSYANDHGEGRVNIEAFDVQGTMAEIKGTFSGNLFYHQSRNTSPIRHRTLSLDLEFHILAERQ